MEDDFKTFYLFSIDESQIQKCLDEISKHTLQDSTQHLLWSIENASITPENLSWILQILNRPLPRGKWDHVRFNMGRVSFGGEGDCTLEDMRLLGETLARRTRALHLNDSSGILECLFSAPNPEIHELSIGSYDLLESECVVIGGLLQWNVHLKRLRLEIEIIEDIPLLVESFANAIHLQSLRIAKAREPRDETSRQADIDCIVRLLQNSQSQLKGLHLREMYLEDRPFMAIVQALPTSRVEVLDVQENFIEREGIEEFARQLPKMKCLKEVYLFSNPWESTGEVDCWSYLLDGIRQSYSLESLHSYSRCSEALLVHYYCRLNWAGRRILLTLSSESVPGGLWPLILQRAGNGTYEYINSCMNDEERRVDEYRAESIYFFLQNCPVLSPIVSSDI